MTRLLIGTILAFLSAPPHLIGVSQPDSARAAQAVVSLASFGARPNEPGLNSRGAFQQALAMLAAEGGGTLLIPTGDYYLDFPDIASDIDPRDTKNTSLLQGKRLSRDKLIVIPPQVIIRGELDRNGRLNTRIHWASTGFPLFSFVDSDRSGLINLEFVFNGLQPQFFPWSQEDLLQALGYRARWLGGPEEISTVIYEIGSGSLRFENLSFHSGKVPPDNEHTFAFGIVMKGKGAVSQPDSNTIRALSSGARVPGGGLYDCVSNNVLRSVHFRDFIMGILATGQCNATMEEIEGDRRGSWYRSFDPTHETGSGLKNIGPPGHLIYLSFQYAYDVVRSPNTPNGEQEVHSTTRNKDITIRNIREGPETLSNVNSLGTLALKNIEGGIVSDISSQHPAGLVQSMVDAHNVRLEDITWSSDRNICEETPPLPSCRIPVITLEPGSNPDTAISSGLQFKNIRLQGPRRAVLFKISQESGQGELSRNITVDGLTIECDPTFTSIQGGPVGAITLRSLETRLSNVHYIAQVRGAGPIGRQNYPVVIQSRSHNVSVQLTVQAELGAIDDRAAYNCVMEDPANNTCQVAR